MTPSDSDVNVDVESTMSDEQIHFEQGLKEMFVDEALFDSPPAGQEPETKAEAEVETVSAPTPTPEPVAEESPAPEQESADQAQASESEDPAPWPAKGPQEEAEAKEAPTDAVIDAPDDVNITDDANDDQIDEQDAERGVLDPGEYLGTDSNVDTYFTDNNEPGFTDADLEGLPLFDDMDEDPIETITKSRSNKSAESGLQGSNKKKPEKKTKPEKKKKPAPAVAADTTKHSSTRPVFKLPALPSQIPVKMVAIGVSAAAALLLAAVGLVSIFSSSESGPGVNPNNYSGGESAFRGPGPNINEEYYIKPGTESETALGREKLAAEAAARERNKPPVLDENRPDSYHDLGVAAYKKGKYSDAISYLENQITSSTLTLASCYQLLGESAEALKMYQRILYEYPDRNAFTEVFGLAEEMFASGDYHTARKLYYAFISQMDRMPGPVKRLVPRAYFKVGRCLEEEAFAILDGKPIQHPESPSEKVEDSNAMTASIFPSGPGSVDGNRATVRQPPSLSRIDIKTRRENEFITNFSIECVSAPALSVFEQLALKAGRSLSVTEDFMEKLNAEVVTAFLQEKTLDEILEYISGQVGFFYSLDEQNLVVTSLEEMVDGDWLAMKDKAVQTFQKSLYRFIGHEDAPKVYFEISKLHYLSGDFDEAITPANTLIMDFPDFSKLPSALLNISKCLMELGDFQKAREHLRTLANKYSSHPSAQEGLLLLARCTWMQGNPAEAKLRINSLIRNFPKSPMVPEGKAVLARILNTQEKYASAVDLLESVNINNVENEETAISILILKAQAYLKIDNPDSAAETVNTMLTKWPENSREREGLFILAECYAAQGQDVLAFATCKNLKAKYPTSRSDPFLYITAAKSLNEMDLHDTALQWLETGVEECVDGTKDAYTMYMLLGNTLYEMKKYERAKVVFNKVRECVEMEKDACINYVKSQMKQKDYRSALDTIKDMLRGAKNDPPFESGLFKMAGDCYIELNDAESAIKAYKGELVESENTGSGK